MFTLINSENLKVEFDPVQTENHYHPSVAFDIYIIFETTLQLSKFTLKEFWLENSEMNRFQKKLQDFIEKKSDFVGLLDMSLNPFLKIERVDEDLFFELKAETHFPSSEVKIKIQIEKDEPEIILAKMKSWEKWW